MLYLPADAQKLPLRGKTSPAPGEDVAQRQKGESGCERSEQTERVLPRRAALSRKAARQLPFPSTTPPVKVRLERSAELVGATPLHLLTQTALPLKSPTGAFIATLRSANAVASNAKF